MMSSGPGDKDHILLEEGMANSVGETVPVTFGTSGLSNRDEEVQRILGQLDEIKDSCSSEDSQWMKIHSMV